MSDEKKPILMQPIHRKSLKQNTKKHTLVLLYVKANTSAEEEKGTERTTTQKAKYADSSSLQWSMVTFCADQEA